MSAEDAHRYLIAYDISADSRRDRVAKLLESYGDRVQYSVFVVDIKPARVVRLTSALRARIDEASDSVLFCNLGPLSHGGLSRISFVGQQRTVTGQGPLFF